MDWQYPLVEFFSQFSLLGTDHILGKHLVVVPKLVQLLTKPEYVAHASFAILSFGVLVAVELAV